MSNTYKTPSWRGSNAVRGDFTIETSADGLRRAYARNVKGEDGPGRHKVVRVWRLVKRDDLKSKWRAFRSQTDQKTAEAFLLPKE